MSILAAAVVLLTITVPVAQAHSEATPPFDELVISFWPEYDHTDPNKSVLLIYQGQLSADVQLPAKINIHVPKDSKVYAATVVGPSGRLMTAPYDQVPAGDFDELTYEINYPKFQLELYHYPTGEGANRTYDFDFRTSAPVGMLGIEIQKPLAATDFTIDPAADSVEQRQDNSNKSFEYHSYVFRDIPKDKDYSFRVAYTKPDTKPSVNPPVATAANGDAVATDRSPGVLVVFLLMGLVAVAAGITVTIRAKSLNENSLSQTTKNFCSECGTKLEASAKFCSECGATAEE